MKDTKTFDGFKVQISRLELENHLHMRARFHTERANELEGWRGEVADKKNAFTQQELEAYGAKVGVVFVSGYGNGIVAVPTKGTQGYASGLPVVRLGMPPKGSQTIADALLEELAAQGAEAKRSATEFEFYASHIPQGVDAFLFSHKECAGLELVEYAARWITGS